MSINPRSLLLIVGDSGTPGRHSSPRHFSRSQLHFAKNVEVPAPVARALGRAAPGLVRGLLSGMLAAALIQELIDQWAQWAYPGFEDSDFFLPIGLGLINDNGGHAPSVPAHLNLLPNTAWASSASDVTHGHGQVRTVGLNPARQYHQYLEADRFPPSAQAWYNRVRMINLAYPGTVPAALVGAVGMPIHRPTPLPWPAPAALFFPAINPDMLPIMQPAPNPLPLPTYWPPMPDSPGNPAPFPFPDGITEPGNVPQPSPNPVPTPVPVPGPSPIPGPVPRAIPPAPPIISVPAISVPVKVPGAAALPPKMVWHPIRRPRRYPEGKSSVGGPMGAAVRGIVGMITEGLDVLDAFWWALPPWARTPWADPLQKGMDVIGYIMGMNGTPSGNDATGYFGRVLGNLGRNAVTDAIIGRMNRATNDALVGTGYYKSPVGYGTGPVDTPPQISGAWHRTRNGWSFSHGAN